MLVNVKKNHRTAEIKNLYLHDKKNQYNYFDIVLKKEKENIVFVELLTFLYRC